MSIRQSELILNPDGSLYHLNLRPEDIATNIILVGDQNRVDKVAQYFSSIDFTTQKREFKTVTGIFRGKKMSVVSTGIGSDNIDIVLNELDALVNIDLKTRKPKEQLTRLKIIRIGTSGSVQKDIPVDCFLMSSYAIAINGMLHFYDTDKISYPEIENSFVKHTQWSSKKSKPIVIANDKELTLKLSSKRLIKGITATAGGFYGPQGRRLRLSLQDDSLIEKITSFRYGKMRITNLEMETSAIYGLSKLLGHQAISMNAIVANRINGTFSKNPEKIITNLIEYTLNKLVE